MIRVADLPNPALWSRPGATAQRVESRDASTWFEGPAAQGRITADLNPAARGLSVAQHASLVLAHLRGE